MCAFINAFRGIFTHFLSCFLRGDNTITTFGQIVTRLRKCLKVSNFPTFHGVQCLMRNAGVLYDFNRKGITPIFLDRVVNGRTLRGVTAQVISHPAWQNFIFTNILFATRRSENIDSGIFHQELLWGCIAKSVLLPMSLGGGRDLALRRG